MKMLSLNLLCTMLVLTSCVDTENFRKFEIEPPQPTTCDPNFHIYLCFGQSNMEGAGDVEEIDKVNVSERFRVMTVSGDDESHNGRTFGEWNTAVPPLCRWNTGLSPIDYFGRTMVEKTPSDIKVGVVMVAMGGAGIEAFDKETYQDYYDSADDWMKSLMNTYNGNPYAKLVEAAKEAQKSGVIKGILLHQGETNNMQQDWPIKVDKIYTDLLNDLNLSCDSVPLLVGETLHQDQGGICYGMNTIIAKLPGLLKNAHVISSEGCPGKDDFHFTSEGYRELGKRYAEKMVKLLVLDREEPMPKLRVEGRYLKNMDGEIVNLHGFAQSYDPYFNDNMWSNYDVAGCLRYNQSLIHRTLAAGWEMDFMRLQMMPYWDNTPGGVAVGDGLNIFDENRFRKYLDEVYVPMMEYVNGKGLYVVVVPPRSCPEVIEIDDEYHKYLINIWDIISSHPKIKDNPYIMFELANEPVRIIGDDGNEGGGGDACFRNLQKYFQKVVDRIRANGAGNIIWVPGLNYMSNFDGYANYPIEGSNIGYAVHLYPGWMGSDGENGDGGSGSGGYQSFQNGWNRQVGPVAAFAPILITEMDWAPAKYNASWGKATTGVLGGFGFGANFKYIVDNSGNVSFLLFTGTSWLAQFKDVPGTPGAYTFLNDPEACPWTVYHWYKEYREGKKDVGVVESISIDNPADGTSMKPGSNLSMMVYANYQDGTRALINSMVSCSSSDQSVVRVAGNTLYALRDGSATITANYGMNEGIMTASITINVTMFPLTADEFNPCISGDGTYDESTHTLVTAQYGCGGWEYPNGLDLSGYKTLSIELESSNIWGGVTLNIYDRGYWDGCASYVYDGSKIEVNLKEMRRDDGSAVDPSSIKIIGIWSYGGFPIKINRIYLSKDEEDNPSDSYFSFNTFNPSVFLDGTFDATTGTLQTGAYGVGGWVFPSYLDLSGFKYLVAELGSDNECGASFNLWENGVWGGACSSHPFNDKRRVVVDLHNMKKDGSDEIFSPKKVNIVGFWTIGSSPIIIKKVYLTNDEY